MRAAFSADELIYIFRNNLPTKGVPNVTMRPAAEWVTQYPAGRFPFTRLAGDCIVPNPFTGEEGETGDGRPSFIASNCIAAFDYVVLEFDDMPLPMQYAFWRGFITASDLAPSLVSLTYSGGKSIHGLLYAGCRTLAEWQAVQARLTGLMAADRDAAYRADVQSMHYRHGTRLAGARRNGDGAVQELAYLNPNARPQSMWHDPTAASTAAEQHPHVC